MYLAGCSLFLSVSLFLSTVQVFGLHHHLCESLRVFDQVYVREDSHVAVTALPRGRHDTLRVSRLEASRSERAVGEIRITPDARPTSARCACYFWRVVTRALGTHRLGRA